MVRESFYMARIQQVDPKHGPARLLRFVQLHVRAWFMASWNCEDPHQAAALPRPALADGLNKVQLSDMTWLPTMPAAYLKATPAKEEGDSRPKSTSVTNPHKNPKFDEFRAKIATTKFNDVIRRVGDPPKVTRNGSEVTICASYHLRGSCFANCGRKADHVSHTEAEDKKLYEWCKRAFE
jgi:hypothetical protein